MLNAQSEQRVKKMIEDAITPLIKRMTELETELSVTVEMAKLILEEVKILRAEASSKPVVKPVKTATVKVTETDSTVETK